MQKMTIIIPMYNESSIIEETAKTLSRYMEDNFESYEILFSNDGSKDNCAALVEALQLPCTKVVGYENNQGKGAAIRYAVGEATGDIIMFTDADLAYGTDVIKRAYDMLCSSPDTKLLLGSRNIANDGYEGYTTIRRVMSRTYIKLIGVVGGFKFSDSQCGCKAFRGAAAKEIFKKCKINGFAFDLEAILWAVELEFKVDEMAVKIINHRESKIHIVKDSLRMMRDAYKIRRSVKKQSKQEKKK